MTTEIVHHHQLYISIRDGHAEGGFCDLANFIFETNGQHKQKVYTFFCHETKIKLAQSTMGQ